MIKPFENLQVWVIWPAWPEISPPGPLELKCGEEAAGGHAKLGVACIMWEMRLHASCGRWGCVNGMACHWQAASGGPSHSQSDSALLARDARDARADQPAAVQRRP
ncbi:hypothetical protein ACLOJK_030238 [Asimina triloba]